MLVRAYRFFKRKLDRLKQRRLQGTISTPAFYLKLFFLRILLQLIVFPHFMLLGPFKTFTTFARKNDTGDWIDSYNDFIISNRITTTGVISLVLIAIVAILVFVYLPIFYL